MLIKKYFDMIQETYPVKTAADKIEAEHFAIPELLPLPAD